MMQPTSLPMQAHKAADCLGPVLKDPTTLATIERYEAACRTVWANMDPLARLNFHKASCLNVVNASTQATIRTVISELRKLGVPA